MNIEDKNKVIALIDKEIELQLATQQMSAFVHTEVKHVIITKVTEYTVATLEGIKLKIQEI